MFIHTSRFREQDTQFIGQHTVLLPVATADTSRLIRAFGKRLKVQGRLSHASDKPVCQELMASLDVLN